MRVLLLLIIAHAICDYPLQGDFLARGKNHRNPIPGVPWWQCLVAHGVIHAGAVYLITDSILLAACELFSHCWADYWKSDGLLSFNIDQAAHVGFKCLYALAAQ